MSKSDKVKIIGSFEHVSFPEFKAIGIVRAKIDTGAYTGALHCTKIRTEEVSGGSVLHFSPFDHPEIQMSANDFIVRYVRSSNGERNKRYFIKTKITLQKHTYPILLSLADRSEMKWSVLIGRSFLRANNFLVDVNKVNK